MANFADHPQAENEKEKKEKKGYRYIPENGRSSFCTKRSKMEFRIRPELAQSFATGWHISATTIIHIFILTVAEIIT